MSGREKPVLVASLVLLGLLGGGCDSSSPTAPATPPPTAGNWQGATEQGKSLAFSVGGSAQAPLVTAYEVTVKIDELMQGGTVACLCDELTVGAQPVGVPIVNGAFEVDISGLGGTTIRFEGKFHSATSASGMLTAETPPPDNCASRGVTSWTAQTA